MKNSKVDIEKVQQFTAGVVFIIILIACVVGLQSCANSPDEDQKQQSEVLSWQDKRNMMICDNGIKNTKDTFKDNINTYKLYDNIQFNITSLKKLETNFADKISVQNKRNEYKERLLTTYAQLGLISKMLEEPQTYSDIKVRNAMEVINGQIQEAQQSYNKLKAEGVSIVGKEGEVKNENKEQQ
jgi:hypothetical protein